jgi:hypothetical protein
MAVNIPFTVQVVDNISYKHIVVTGGSSAEPFDFLDIYDQIKIMKPEWVNQLGTGVFLFRVPLIIGDSSGEYNTVIDSEGESVVICRQIISTESYDSYLKIIGSNGIIDSDINIYDGNLTVETVLDESAEIVLSGSIKAGEFRLTETGSNSSDIVNIADRMIDAEVFINHSLAKFSKSDFLKQVHIYKYDRFTECRFRSHIRIDIDVELESPKFDIFSVEFIRAGVKLDLINTQEEKISSVFTGIVTGGSAGNNTINFRSISDVKVSDVDGSIIAGANVKIINQDDDILFSDVTSSLGLCVVDFTAYSIEILEPNSTITECPIAEYLSLIVMKDMTGNSMIFHNIKLGDIEVIINFEIVYYTKFNGLMIDIDNKISSVNRISITRGSSRIIKAKVYNQDGVPISADPSSILMKIFIDSFDVDSFLEFEALVVRDDGEVLFEIPSSETAKLEYDRYFYTITVLDQILISDHIDIK